MPFMLNNIRGALKGVVAWMFAIVGIAAFSVVGVPSLQNFGAQDPIKVGNVTVTQREVQNVFNREILNLQRQSGRAYTREEALTSGLQDRIVQDLAIRSALRVEAGKLGLVMPRTLIREILGREETFQNSLTGKFDEAQLQRILQQNNLSPSQFDTMIRADLVQQNLVQAISTGPFAPRALADVYLARQTDQRRITWISVTDAMAGTAIEPTDEDLQTWYADNEDNFTAPEYRTMSIAFLRNQDFQDGRTVPEEDLQKLYETNIARYQKPERRTLYQLTYPNEADALAVVERLRLGEPFEAIAIERGLTLEAATLAEVTPDEILDAQVREAAFAPGLEVGDIPDAVKNVFGSTVLQLVDIVPASTDSFESVREELETASLSREIEQDIFDAIDTIERSRDEGGDLQQAAEAAGIPLRQFGPVDQFSLTPDGAILNDIPVEALEEAFNLDEGGEGSELIQLADDGGYLFVGVDSIIDPRVKPFEEVRGEVDQAWRADERRERVLAKTTEITDRLTNGESLETIAQSLDRAPITEALQINQTTHDTLSDIAIGDIFSANLNEVVTGPARDASTRIVAEVRDIEFTRGGIGAAELAGFQQFLGTQLNQELLSAYVNTLQETYDVKINQAMLDRMFALEDG